jgi:hypothetical protein
MVTLEEKIQRTQRLLRRLQDDEAMLAIRLAQLGQEQRESSTKFAAQIMAQTQAELQRLMEARASVAYSELAFPAPAD